MSDSTTSTTASTAVYQRVSRTRTESSMALPDWRSGLGARPRRSAFVGRVGDIRIDLRAKEVAGAAAGMEQGLAGIGVNFPAHAIHVNFDQIREGIKGLIPHVFGDIRAPHNATGVAGKIFEQRIFFGGELRPARETLCAAVSRTRSATTILAGRSSPERRSSARSRARSSRNSNGFVR